MMFLVFLTLLVFSSAEECGCFDDTSDMTTNLPLQEMVPRTISEKSSTFNDIPRQEIVEALRTGGRPKTSNFQKILTEILLLNVTIPISDLDLALWISALIARGDNPRSQNGIDMVADLLRRVSATKRPMTYLVLTLCNSHAITHDHLKKIVKYTSPHLTHYNTRQLELDSLVLKTLVCAASLPNAHQQKLDQFTDLMADTAKKIAETSGHFDNIYTTSLVVQALTSYNRVIDAALEWGEKEALDFLRKESTTGSPTKVYYIAMALNAGQVPFLKDLHKPSFGSQLSVKKDIQVTLSIKSEGVTEDGFALQLKVPGNWNLFEILLRAANFSSRFRFAHSLNKKGEPQIFEVGGTPNDPERGLYWMICTTQRTQGDVGNQTKTIPFDGENITLWYRSTDCPNV